MLKPLEVGNRVIKNNLLLAPLAGFTDRSFRDIAVDYGVGLAYTEMVSCEALWRGSDKTENLLHKSDNETEYAIQIFTGEVSSAIKALPKVLDHNPLLIDINCGCPVPKITKSGAGSALMQTPNKIYEIVNALKNECDTPITIKIRSGWDSNSLNFLEVAEYAQKANVDLITIHPRTRKQGYSGKANWEHIKQLKRNSSVPVIGNGDILNYKNVKEVMEYSQCDGVMIARGSIGNPFIFEDAINYLTGKNVVDRSVEETVQTALKQLHLAIKYFGEERACKEMRKQFCAYTKGLKGGSSVRNRIVHANSEAEYKNIIKEYIANLS